jgi:hypothetical protein
VRTPTSSRASCSGRVIGDGAAALRSRQHARPRAAATNGSIPNSGSGSNCARGRDGSGEAGEAGAPHVVVRPEADDGASIPPAKTRESEKQTRRRGRSTTATIVLAGATRRSAKGSLPGAASAMWWTEGLRLQGRMEECTPASEEIVRLWEWDRIRRGYGRAVVPPTFAARTQQ